MSGKTRANNPWALTLDHEKESISRIARHRKTGYVMQLLANRFEKELDINSDIVPKFGK